MSQPDKTAKSAAMTADARPPRLRDQAVQVFMSSSLLCFVVGTALADAVHVTLEEHGQSHDETSRPEVAQGHSTPLAQIYCK